MGWNVGKPSINQGSKLRHKGNPEYRYGFSVCDLTKCNLILSMGDAFLLLNVIKSKNIIVFSLKMFLWD